MAINQAIVLIDWNNVQARLDANFHSNPRKRIKPLVLRIQQEIAHLLSNKTGGAKFRVSMRVYHGWHQDRIATQIRTDFEIYQVYEQLARTIGSVSFTLGYAFGNELCCYVDPIPLYNTYRGGGQDKGQKMVDTAIVCDMLHYARENPDTFVIIVSDDDDFLPGIIMAKSWQRRANGKCFQVRVEKRSLDFVTDDSLSDEVIYWRMP